MASFLNIDTIDMCDRVVVYDAKHYLVVADIKDRMKNTHTGEQFKYKDYCVVLTKCGAELLNKKATGEDYIDSWSVDMQVGTLVDINGNSYLFNNSLCNIAEICFLNEDLPQVSLENIVFTRNYHMSRAEVIKSMSDIEIAMYEDLVTFYSDVDIEEYDEDNKLDVSEVFVKHSSLYHPLECFATRKGLGYECCPGGGEAFLCTEK